MLLLGKPVADKIYDEVRKTIRQNKLKPFLAVILIGENPESLSFIRAKEKIASSLNIGFRLYQYPDIVRQDEIISMLNNLNKNDFVSGIVVQLPLPKKINTDEIIRRIDPKKDIDGFNGNFSTPAATAVLEILKYYHIDLKNKKIVLVGHGKLVGEPLEKILLEQEIYPDILDSETSNLTAVTQAADILICATGKAELIKQSMVKKNTVIIDAGTAEVSGKISGDVSLDVYDKVAAISPVPGGVGPVTVACLMKNLIKATMTQR